jgi:hypothetical protein
MPAPAIPTKCTGRGSFGSISDMRGIYRTAGMEVSKLQGEWKSRNFRGNEKRRDRDR